MSDKRAPRRSLDDWMELVTECRQSGLTDAAWCEAQGMINDLKKMIKTLQATVDAANKREEALTQERDNLKEEVDLLRKKLFGSSSEKRSMDVPGQLNLFNEAELEQNPTIAEPEV